MVKMKNNRQSENSRLWLISSLKLIPGTNMILEHLKCVYNSEKEDEPILEEIRKYDIIGDYIWYISQVSSILILAGSFINLMFLKDHKIKRADFPEPQLVQVFKFNKRL